MNNTLPDSMGSNASPIPVRSERDQRKQFTYPKEPKKDRDKAAERLWNTLDKVPDIVHFKKTGLRKTATLRLYVGNLEFKASAEDLSNALNQIFIRIQVEKITIPQGNGRRPGYAIIDLSWAAEAPVIDICVAHSDMIFVNSRHGVLYTFGSWTARLIVIRHTLLVSRQISQWLRHALLKRHVPR